MYEGQMIFSQMMDYIPRRTLDSCIRRYGGNYKVRKFSCRDQFMCMAFAQLTSRQSLREIETCLRAVGTKLYHAGLRGHIARNTLAKANENRSWKIWKDLAMNLIKHARSLYTSESLDLDIDQTVYAFDSTTIDLCLSLFPWAEFRRHKGAVKLHTLIDLRGNIPCFIRITDGKVHDVNALDDLPMEAGSYYVMDRGYVDFTRLYRFERAKAFFVTRAKKGFDFNVIKSRQVDKATGLRCDQTITLSGSKTSKKYPDQLRRISYTDPDTGKRFVFITNNFLLDALTIAKLYKARWQVELFFKWIKQNLRIKVFLGTSFNAVKTQIWIAVCVYVLIAIIAKEQNIDRNMNEILQILGMLLFEQVPMYKALTKKSGNISKIDNYKQLSLFNL